MTEQYLPEIYSRFRQQFPELSENLEALAQSANAGPLDERTSRLVKLGIAIGAMAEGAVRSNARRALHAGATPEELRQVVALTVTTRGFPAAVAAYSWVEEVLDSHTAAGG
jgi:alkylhydroperoxidase/carboxymuconolactone decarboxylase family protein YurZ